MFSIKISIYPIVPNPNVMMDQMKYEIMAEIMIEIDLRNLLWKNVFGSKWINFS